MDNFSSKLKKLAGGKQIFMPRLMAGAKTSVLWFLGVDPHVLLKGSISSSPCSSFVTAYFKDTAETLPKTLICLLMGKLSYFAIFICSEMCYNCNVILGTP